MAEMMTTQEVAAYLRIKERKVYDLVKEGRIPCRRVTGKWLFPKALIEAWVDGDETGVGTAPARTEPAGACPPVISGSQDPLLDWCLHESDCGLAMLPVGSLEGLRRFLAGAARVSGLHILDAGGGDYNLAALRAVTDGSDLVMIEWAWRQQGLVLAEGNPLGIAGLADLADSKARILCRQPDAGSQILLDHLLDVAGIGRKTLTLLDRPARTESDLAAAIAEGKADVGLAVAAVAQQHRLGFIPLHRERYDLVMHRRDYFEPAMQTLLGFARSAAFRAQVRGLAGYDCSNLGRVIFNGS